MARRRNTGCGCDVTHCRVVAKPNTAKDINKATEKYRIYTKRRQQDRRIREDRMYRYLCKFGSPIAIFTRLRAMTLTEYKVDENVLFMFGIAKTA